MKIQRHLVYLGFFNILGWLFTEMMLISGWVGDIHSFNNLSIFGIVFVLVNGMFLYYAIKKGERLIIILTILLAVMYGIYQIFSIAAISYRFLLVIDGTLLLGFSKQ